MKVYRSRKAGENIRRTYDQLLAQWGVPVTERDVEGSYGTTHVIVAGEPTKPPLVLFHGVGDDSALMWLYNAKALAAEHCLYAVDTIGGPGKSVPGAGYNKNFDDLKWLDETLDALQLTQTDVMGVSNGGCLTQMYTLRRPERVRRAVVISSAVPYGPGSPLKIMMRIFMPEALFPTKGNTARLIRKLSGDHPEVFLDHPLVMEHYQWLLKGFNNMAMGYHRLERFSDAEVDAIRGRTTYLVGEKDPFQLLGGRELLQTLHMNMRAFPDAGHGLNHELADTVNEAVLELLR